MASLAYTARHRPERLCLKVNTEKRNARCGKTLEAHLRKVSYDQ